MESELLLDERQGLFDHVIDGNGGSDDRGRATERSKMRNNLGRLAYLLHGVPQVSHDLILIELVHLDMIDDVPNEEPDVVQRIVELMGDTRCEFAKRRQLPRLDQLLLLLAKFMFAALNFLRRLTQIAHDVDHRLAALFETSFRDMDVLENVEERPT